MEQKKGKMHIILPVLVVAVILVFYFFNFRIGSYLHPDETAYSMEELTQLVTEQINDGKKMCIRDSLWDVTVMPVGTAASVDQDIHF